MILGDYFKNIHLLGTNITKPFLILDYCAYWSLLLVIHIVLWEFILFWLCAPSLHNWSTFDLVENSSFIGLGILFMDKLCYELLLGSSLLGGGLVVVCCLIVLNYYILSHHWLHDMPFMECALTF